MKYTKLYLQEHKVAVHIGFNTAIAKEIDEYIGHSHSYLYKSKNGYDYGEELAIDLGNHCHCRQEFYKSEGYEIVEVEDFLIDIRGIFNPEIY